MTVFVELPKTEASELRRRIAAWLETLNFKEQVRRKEVNAEHFAKYGRELYPHGGAYARFYLDAPGRKYTRVVMETEDGSKSVHAFVILGTGEVLKSAGWGKPAAGTRFDLRSDADFERILERCDFAGGYLYR